jgi:hypothetical protein
MPCHFLSVRVERRDTAMRPLVFARGERNFGNYDLVSPSPHPDCARLAGPSRTCRRHVAIAREAAHEKRSTVHRQLSLFTVGDIINTSLH